LLSQQKSKVGSGEILSGGSGYNSCWIGDSNSILHPGKYNQHLCTCKKKGLFISNKCPQGKTLKFSENNMPMIQFVEKPGEKILYRNTPNRKWYVLTWKIISGSGGITIITIVVYSLLASKTGNAVNSFLPAWIASLIIKLIFLGLIPLAGIAWVIEDIACVFIGEFILTDQRMWIRGSPYAWSQSEIPLEEILSMTWRRDAIFIRKKSTRKMLVHMFSNGRSFVQTYQQFVGKTNDV
jgi:hypothetical protein